MKACQVTKQAELRKRLKAQSTEHTIRVELLQAVQKDLVCDEPWVLRFGVQHVRLAQQPLSLPVSGVGCRAVRCHLCAA